MPLPPELERTLWAAADELWTNGALRPSEYAAPVLALIFLRYAGARSAVVPERARFERLLSLPEDACVGAAIDEAMRAIEASSPALEGVLPKAYGQLDGRTLRALVALFGALPADVDGAHGDVFGRIYEYFLGRFAPASLQKGGEFYTPPSVVRLIVEVLEPYHGKILDPACGSGGMFVQSARFRAAHGGREAGALRVYGIEKVAETARLAKMNLAVHGLSGQIVEGNAYYDAEAHREHWGTFDFCLANPPFNQGAVDKARLADAERRFSFGLPSADNANYLWIQLFYSALGDTGRAGFVMANSASDARGGELEIRKRLVASGAVDVVISLSSNLFYTVTLPVTLWFLDKAKPRSLRRGEILFIDARQVFRQVDRAHRELTDAQVEYLANVARLYRGQTPEDLHGGGALLRERFPGGVYVDVPGLCRVAGPGELEAQGYSLNPGRYVGVSAPDDEPAFDVERLAELRAELATLTRAAHALEQRIAADDGDLFGPP